MESILTGVIVNIIIRLTYLVKAAIIIKVIMRTGNFATTRFSVCKKLLMRMAAFKPGLYINAYSAESVVFGQKFLSRNANFTIKKRLVTLIN